MNEYAFTLLAAIRVLMYQFMAVSLLASAIIRYRKSSNIIVIMHILAALLLSSIGVVVFLDFSGLFELSQRLKGVIITPILFVLSSFVWIWLIGKQREEIVEAEKNGLSSF